MDEEVRTTSTSKHTADISEIVLRQTVTTRLIFRPVLIEDNPKDPRASLRGEFVFQKKGLLGNWEDHSELNLAKLKATEWVKLELKSDELLSLFERLGSYYKLADTFGVQSGSKTYVPEPQNPVLQELLKSDKNLTGLFDEETAKVISSFINWLAKISGEEFAQRIKDISSDELAHFDALIGAAHLRNFLRTYELAKDNSEESFWQELFEKNSWVISQVFAFPLVIMRGQAYVGGKSIANQGGHIVDFAYKNQLTENIALVEIKTPATKLLANKEYRQGIYAPSYDLVGATQQLLASKTSLIEEFHSLLTKSGVEFQAFSPRVLLIAGSLESQAVKGDLLRSFEVYRGSLRDVELITFDELRQKIQNLVQLLEG